MVKIKDFIDKIYNDIKNNKPTIILFIVTFILTFFINIGLFIMVVMSTDIGINTLSIFIAKDLLMLFGIYLLVVALVTGMHFISIVLIFVLRKRFNLNIKMYLKFILVHSLPFILLMTVAYANPTLEYRETRVNQIRIDRGEIVKDTDIYNLLSRYLEIDNKNDILDMVKQDNLIYSVEYEHLVEYLYYVKVNTEDESLKKVLKIYNQEFPEIERIFRYDKYIYSYLELINKFKDSNMTIDKIHNEVKLFMQSSVKNNERFESKTIDEELEEILPRIVLYENIYILDFIDTGYDEDYHKDRLLKGNLNYSKQRIKKYVEGKSYDYQYGEDNQIKEKELYIKYCEMIDSLLAEDYLTKDKALTTIKEFSEKYKLNLKDSNLNELQILINGK